MQPGKLLLQTTGACDFDPEHMLDVFGRQRQRFVAVLQGFGPDDWAAPTRCTDWSAHDVIRHLCDNNMRAAAIGPDDRMLDITAGYDPRITPREWLSASAGESPDATLSRFLATTEQRLALDRARLAEGARFDVLMPYGPMDWTVRVLHGSQRGGHRLALRRRHLRQTVVWADLAVTTAVRGQRGRYARPAACQRPWRSGRRWLGRMP